MPTSPLLAILILILNISVEAAAQVLPELPARVQGPGFELPDLEGGIHRLAEQRGKVVLINFWATWCPPCRKEMPSLKRLWGKLGTELFTLYAVDAGEETNLVSEFLFEADIENSFTVLLDREGGAMRQWRVPGLPTTFILDKTGRIVHRVVGGREWDSPEIVDRLRVLQKE